jgi:hypothetical protein
MLLNKNDTRHNQTPLMKFSKNDNQHKKPLEQCFSVTIFIVMLGVFVPSIIMLNVVAPLIGMKKREILRNKWLLC